MKTYWPTICLSNQPMIITQIVSLTNDYVIMIIDNNDYWQ